MNENNNLMFWLQRWYDKHCDGDWEHNQNIIITTIDNPGWSVKINLEDTEWENKHMEPVLIEKNAQDWLCYRIEHKKFLIDCGPYNLLEAIALFKEFTQEKT